MAQKNSSTQGPRARRYALHVPVYFRQLGNPTWLEGTTENVSFSGVLFQSPWALSLETPLEVRLQVPLGGKGLSPAEICSKAVVVRVEQRDMPETPVALAVAMRDPRILPRKSADGRTVGNALESTRHQALA